ncbi:hypothetical protein JF710_16650 [Mycobacterium intracellulare]|uniref:hypothetical protein n=1 Tax=Mycobacterium intracellulare TaxID=1767 RepID=UPI001CDB287A|nr:hypothetical protein [Mycobacterium intracellulare]MCA2254811.1 hypothetical protein [Mycobacterium intracellulare]
MAPDRERWATLTGLDVTYAQRWCSAWADLLLTDMALMYRAELEPTMENMFRRRAYWESATVSYGRLIVSDKKRKIPFKEFIGEVTGDDGLALHEQIMNWRQQHVAHRTGNQYESVETVLAFEHGSATPNALKIVLGVDMGPLDDSEFVEAFREHVKTLRDAMYERKLHPLGEKIIEYFNATRPLVQIRPALNQSSLERYVVEYRLFELAGGEAAQ